MALANLHAKKDTGKRLEEKCTASGVSRLEEFASPAHRTAIDALAVDASSATSSITCQLPVYVLPAAPMATLELELKSWEECACLVAKRTETV